MHLTPPIYRFGAACCFAAEGSSPPTDATLDAIIDRSRTEADSIAGLQGNQQRTAADFDASSNELNMRQLQGAVYGELLTLTLTLTLSCRARSTVSS